jgi:transcriptional regulator with XRE-family HTH domain
MATTKFADPNDIPVNALRCLLGLPQKQREFVKAYLECSDDIQAVVRSMFAILDSHEATADDRHRALTTIADALYLNPHRGNYGMDLVDSEAEAAKEHPLLAQQVRHMDQEESTFAERLRELLERKCVSQSELADRADCSQSAISHMLNRNCRPQKRTILKLAAALQVEPAALWPDLEVADILDTVASFQAERELTSAEAASLREAAKRAPAQVNAKRLPSRKRKR